MDAPEIEKLKALALAATQGEWKNYHGLIEDETAGFSIATVRAYFTENEAIQAANANYIAVACPATALALIAEVERLRARFEYIEENAVTYGGGNGFEVRFFVPIDEEDIGSGIDAAIAASKEKANA